MKVYVWEFMPFDGQEIVVFTLTELNYFLLKEGLRLVETQKIIFSAIQQPVHINDIGTFRRIS